MTWTARNAGAVTIGGERRPPAVILNVAGTRALVEPPFEPDPPDPLEPEGPLEPDPLEPDPLEPDPLDPDPEMPAPPEAAPPDPPDGEAPPLALVEVVPAPPVLVEPDVLVEPCAVELPVVDGDAVDVGAVVLLATVVEELCVVLECEEPPQPAIVNKAAQSAERTASRLTFSA